MMGEEGEQIEPQPEAEKEQEDGREEQQEEEEYESDLEDQLLPSAMRRREASDDESDGGKGKRSLDQPRKMDRTSDGESNGEGGPPAYEDDEEEYDEEDDLLEEEELEYEVVEEDGRGGRKVVTEMMGERRVSDHGENVDGGVEGENQGEGEGGEKKTNEPFAVPTAGAFYMHDDRFRGSRGGRHKRMRGGRKLWETKDDRAWVHDRFEEMTLQDTHRSEDRRGYRGRYRGRGRTRGTGRGYGRGNRSQSYEGRPRANNERPQARDERSSAYDDRTESYNEKKNQTNAPKIIRGRGPRRYEPFSNNNSSKENMPFNRPKQNQKMHEPLSSSTSERQSSHASTVQPETVVHRNQVFNSSLNSASPPFYPSGTTSQDSSVLPNRNVQTGDVRDSGLSSISGNSFAPTQSTTYLRGKTSLEYNSSHKKQPIDESQSHITGKPTSVVHASGSSVSSSITAQFPDHRVQGRGPSVSRGQQNYQQSSLPDKIGRISAPRNSSTVQSRLSQTSALHVLRSSAPQSGQYSSTATSSSPNLQVQSANISEVGDSESPTALSKSNAIVSGRDKTISQTGGRGTILYNGAQFIGANGALALAHGDQNFPGTPALLPVMQLPGQPNGGVPTVGMALPGYVAQPQLGFGGSEVSWLPMLAGTAGATGPSYAPYITLDGGYHARQTGIASSSTAPKEISSSKSDSTWKTCQRSEQENDEFGQRQNKPRRYSEMNFGQ